MKIPDRPDDSAESFKAQQEAIAKQVQAKMDERFDREVKDLLDKDNK